MQQEQTAGTLTKGETARQLATLLSVSSAVEGEGYVCWCVCVSLGWCWGGVEGRNGKGRRAAPLLTHALTSDRWK